ncbi:MAG: hypothetical protein FWH37_01185 [Candidatus Bathyarchaeota archaeon]|nr:hypothetical protein [Candidatus Termiticorpusculum sp.]
MLEGEPTQNKVNDYWKPYACYYNPKFEHIIFTNNNSFMNKYFESNKEFKDNMQIFEFPCIMREIDQKIYTPKTIYGHAYAPHKKLREKTDQKTHKPKGDLQLMMKFDTPQIIQKIMVETGQGEHLSKVMAQQLNNVHEKLYPVVKAWANGIEKPFEFTFQGKKITLDEVQNRYKRTTRIDAILTMNSFLNNPDSIKRYNNLQFIQK